MANFSHLLKFLGIFLLISASLGHDMDYGEEGCADEGEHKCMACKNLQCVDNATTEPPTTTGSQDGTTSASLNQDHGGKICGCKEGFQYDDAQKACAVKKEDDTFEPIDEGACSSAPVQATISKGILFTIVGFFMIFQF